MNKWVMTVGGGAINLSMYREMYLRNYTNYPLIGTFVVEVCISDDSIAQIFSGTKEECMQYIKDFVSAQDRI